MAAAQPRTESESLVVEAFRETFLAGDPDAVADYFASALEYVRSSGELATRKDLRADVEMFITAFPDLDGEVTRVTSEDRTVSLFYTLRGTHEGAIEGIPPTHERMSARGAAVVTLDDDEITGYRIVYDNLQMLEDLDLIDR
jgi:steroid delta-isomerase-like uncharacterized protein